MCVVEILQYQKCVKTFALAGAPTSSKYLLIKLLRKRATKTLDHTLVIYLLSGAVV